jgi:hypothetical protein
LNSIRFEFLLFQTNSTAAALHCAKAPPVSLPPPPLFGLAVWHGRARRPQATAGRAPPVGRGGPVHSLSLSRPSPTTWHHLVNHSPPPSLPRYSPFGRVSTPPLFPSVSHPRQWPSRRRCHFPHPLSRRAQPTHRCLLGQVVPHLPHSLLYCRTLSMTSLVAGLRRYLGTPSNGRLHPSLTIDPTLGSAPPSATLFGVTPGPHRCSTATSCRRPAATEPPVSAPSRLRVRRLRVVTAPQACPAHAPRTANRPLPWLG